jgi:hypothetical protein
MNGYDENNETEKKFVETMDDKMKIALNIAVEHLGTSFHLSKSNGYKKYKKDDNK